MTEFKIHENGYFEEIFAVKKHAYIPRKMSSGHWVWRKPYYRICIVNEPLHFYEGESYTSYQWMDESEFAYFTLLNADNTGKL